MRLHLFMLAVLLALPVTTTRAADDAQAKQRDALHAMLRSHAGIEIRLERKSGLPEFVRRGAAPLAHAKSATDEARVVAALEFLSRNKSLYRLRDPENELLLKDSKTDARGFHHYAFQQHVRGVPVRDAELRAHFDESGALYALTATTLPSLNEADVTPRVDEAAAVAATHALIRRADVETATQLELRDISGNYRLVYAMDSLVNGINRWQTVVDARSGEVLAHFLDHRDGNISASGTDLLGSTRKFNAWQESGAYWLVDVKTPVYTGREAPLSRLGEYGDTYALDLRNSEGETQEFIQSGSANGGWDAAGVSAFANGQAAYRYFRDVHHRRGVDDRNAHLLFAVHYGANYDNAFWNGDRMVFGDGGRRYTNLAGCLDIVGHEMTHGVIEHSADLRYANQSGALNESIADVFGTLIENRNWLMAEDCTKVSPGHMRNMENPHDSRAWQPAHMSEYVNRPNTEAGDWGGVHINSGIPNRAAYLLAEGLSNERIGTSIGRYKLGLLYYRALTVYLAPASEFIDLRRGLLLAANDVFPGDAGVRNAVIDAFDAVGIIEGQDSTDDIIEAPSGTLEASTTRLDFGDVPVGEARSLSLMLLNHSDADVVVEHVELADGRFTHNFAGARLAPGSSLEGTITFTGEDFTGTHAGTIVFHVSDGATLSVDLLATVTTRASGSEDTNPASDGGGAIGLFVFLLLPLVRYRRRERRAR